jgi:glutamate--cysteine ligase
LRAFWLRRVLTRALPPRFGWEAIMEDDFIIGAKLDGQSVTLEPGGQFELSGTRVPRRSAV